MPRLTHRLALSGIVLLGLAGCGGDDAGSSATPDSDQIETPAGDTTLVTSPDTQAAGRKPPPDLPDGTHTAYLTGLDVEARKVSFDKVQFLDGEAAQAAYQKAHPDDPEGFPPNDFIIVNENPKVRTLVASEEAQVTLIRLAEDGDADSDPGTFEELGAYLWAQPEVADDVAAPYSPFNLVVSGGEIVAIEEVYLP